MASGTREPGRLWTVAATDLRSPLQDRQISGDHQRSAEVSKSTCTDGFDDNFRTNTRRITHRYNKWFFHKVLFLHWTPTNSIAQA